MIMFGKEAEAGKRILMEGRHPSCNERSLKRFKQASQDEIFFLLTQALKVAEKIWNVDHKNYTLKNIASAMAQAGNFKLALQVAEKTSNNESVLKDIASATALAGKLELALQVVEKINDHSNKKASALKDIASAAALAGMESQFVIDIFNQALQATKKIWGDSHKASVFKEIASAAALAEMEPQFVSDVFAQALQSVEKLAYLDRDSAFKDLASAAAQAGNFNLALQIAEKMINFYEKSSVLKDIASAAAQAGMKSQFIADVFAQALKTAGTHSPSLTDLASAAAQAGMDPQLVSDVFAQALQTAEKTRSVILKSYYLKKVASAMAQAGKVKAAFSIAEKIKSNDEKASAFTNIASAAAQAGMESQFVTDVFNQALQTAKKIWNNNHRSSALTNIASAAAQAGMETHFVYNVFVRALQAAKKIGNDFDKSFVLENITTAVVQAGIINQIITLARSIKGKGARATALVRIALAIVQLLKLPQENMPMLLHTRIYAVLGMEEEFKAAPQLEERKH